jgi:hypothetical protein
MKTQPNLTAAVSIAALLTGSVIFAQDAEPVTPEIAICEPAPEIAVCPEPCILPEPVTPEICIFPLPTEPPIEEPVDVDIHIDPGVEDPTDAEGPTDTEFTDGGEGLVDENEVVDSGDSSETPSETDLTEGGDRKPDENEVVDSSDPNANYEVTTTVDDDSVDFEKGVPIEWLKRGGSNGDSPEIYYSMAPNPVAGNPVAGNPVAGNPVAGNPVAGNPVAGNPAPLVEKEEAPNALARGLGQDDKAAAIMMEANDASPKILSEKNEPTALIKKGRVFLR